MEEWNNTKQEQYSRPPRLKPRDAGRANTPWPRPGMQGLSSMDYTPELLQLLYSVPAKSRLPIPYRSRDGEGGPVLSRRDPGTGQHSKKNRGFTLLEVMIAVSIIAITLVAVFGSQSQSLSLANEAKFNTTAALLAQKKIAEIEAKGPLDLNADSGDFGEDFPGYQWDLSVSDVSLAGTSNVEYLKQVDLTLFWGDRNQYKYRLRLYRFVPKTKS